MKAAVKEPHKSQIVEDGHRDSKGRLIGHQVKIEKQLHHRKGVLVTQQPSEMDVKFAVRVHSTRDGQGFGAIPHPRVYDTLDEATKGAERQLANARTSVARKVAKGVGRQFAKAAS